MSAHPAGLHSDRSGTSQPITTHARVSALKLSVVSRDLSLGDSVKHGLSPPHTPRPSELQQGELWVEGDANFACPVIEEKGRGELRSGGLVKH